MDVFTALVELRDEWNPCLGIPSLKSSEKLLTEKLTNAYSKVTFSGHGE